MASRVDFGHGAPSWRIPFERAAMTGAHFAEGQVLFREGDPADGVFRVLSGTVDVLRELDGDVDDAIVGFAQPLTEALNQLASVPRRASDLIEELCRPKDLHLDPAGGSSGRTARAVFHDAHLPINCPARTVPRRMGSMKSEAA
jgi:hypothetical protein